MERVPALGGLMIDRGDTPLDDIGDRNSKRHLQRLGDKLQQEAGLVNGAVEEATSTGETGMPVLRAQMTAGQSCSWWTTIPPSSGGSGRPTSPVSGRSLGAHRCLGSCALSVDTNQH
jgi:hypothetical protein